MGRGVHVVDRRETSGVSWADPEAAAPAADTVLVEYWAAARDAAGVETERVAAGPLDDVLAQVARCHPRLVPILRVCSVFVDGEQVPGAGQRAAAAESAAAELAGEPVVEPAGGKPAGAAHDPGPELAPGARVEILPPFAGG